MILLVVVFSFILLVGDTVAKDYFTPRGLLTTVPSGLNNRINPGDTFYLFGVVGDQVESFSVHFAASAKAHVLGHFEFKYTENLLIFETQKDGDWGNEIHELANPIPKNQRFIAEFQFHVNKIRFLLGDFLIYEHTAILPIELMDTVSVDGLTVYDWFLIQANYGNDTILQIPRGSFKEEKEVHMSGYALNGLYSIGFMTGYKNVKYFAFEGDANLKTLICYPKIGGVTYGTWQFPYMTNFGCIDEMQAFDFQLRLEDENKISIRYNGRKLYMYKNKFDMDYIDVYEMFYFTGIQATYVNFGKLFVV